MECSYFQSGSCRSCTQLPQAYSAQLSAKQQQCRSLLSLHTQTQWLPPVASKESGFRNKAKMVVSGTSERPLLGIMDEAGLGVDLSQCPLYPTQLQECLPVVAEFITLAKIAPYRIGDRQGELKYVIITMADHSGDFMLRFVLRSQEPITRLRKHLPQLLEALPKLKVVSANLQPEHKAVLEGKREILLTEQAALELKVNDVPMYLRPQSFFQTNTEVAAALYRQARQWVNELEPRSIWDLFCGVGGFALHCAGPQRKITGIEISPEAIACAERSRDELGLPDIRFKAWDAADFAVGNREIPELVIVNPPRRGIGTELCRFLDSSTARWLIYSSCNTESLATDLGKMPRFKLQSARMLDMFPHTNHYEIIALLTKN